MNFDLTERTVFSLYRRADHMEPPGARDRHLVPEGHRVRRDEMAVPAYGRTWHAACALALGQRRRGARLRHRPSRYWRRRSRPQAPIPGKHGRRERVQRDPVAAFPVAVAVAFRRRQARGPRTPARTRAARRRGTRGETRRRNSPLAEPGSPGNSGERPRQPGQNTGIPRGRVFAIPFPPYCNPVDGNAAWVTAPSAESPGKADVRRGRHWRQIVAKTRGHALVPRGGC